MKLTILDYVYWENKPEFLLNQDINKKWIMYVIENGSCSFEIGGKKGNAGSGDILICPPNVLFKRWINQPLTFHFVWFDTDISNNKSLTKISLKDLVNQDRLNYDILILNNTRFMPINDVLNIREHIIADIFLAGSLESLSLEKKNSSYDEVIKKTMHLLSQSEFFNLSIADIADMFNFSPAYFSKLFSSIMGYSPLEYRNRVKISMAKKKLTESDDSLSNISQVCGYPDQFYFSRFFRKRTGKTPSAYRKEHK